MVVTLCCPRPSPFRNVSRHWVSGPCGQTASRFMCAGGRHRSAVTAEVCGDWCERLFGETFVFLPAQIFGSTEDAIASVGDPGASTRSAVAALTLCRGSATGLEGDTCRLSLRLSSARRCGWKGGPPGHQRPVPVSRRWAPQQVRESRAALYLLCLFGQDVGCRAFSRDRPGPARHRGVAEFALLVGRSSARALALQISRGTLRQAAATREFCPQCRGGRRGIHPGPQARRRGPRSRLSGTGCRRRRQRRRRRRRQRRRRRRRRGKKRSRRRLRRTLRSRSSGRSRRATGCGRERASWRLQRQQAPAQVPVGSLSQ